MAPVPHAEWQNELREAIGRRFGSLNGYARHLAGSKAGPKAVEAKRRPMMKWLQEEDPVVPNATSVAKLHRDGIDFDPTLLPTRTKPRHRTTEELVVLMEKAREAQERMWTEMERIADAVQENQKSLSVLLAAHDDSQRRRRSNG